MPNSLHRWPAVDSGWYVHCRAATLRQAQLTYLRERDKPRAAWSFWLKWEPV